MKMEIVLNNKTIFNIPEDIALEDILKYLENKLSLSSQDFYCLHNGKRVNFPIIEKFDRIHIVPRLCGGKGGFGSMLRAIGAQIEKTTNREACRDLSGRRLRDINEEKRLKTWIAQQAEREKEAMERKKKKLEKLCEEPKFEFKDDNYDQLRKTLGETVEDAVTQGLQASCSTKRKTETVVKAPPKKKSKRWFDEELEVSSSDDDSSNEGSDNEKEKSKIDFADSENSNNSGNNVKTNDSDSGETKDEKVEESAVEDKSKTEESK